MSKLTTVFFIFQKQQQTNQILCRFDKLSNTWTLPQTTGSEYEDLNKLINRSLKLDKQDFQIEAIRYREKTFHRLLFLSINPLVDIQHLLKNTRLQWKNYKQAKPQNWQCLLTIPQLANY